MKYIKIILIAILCIIPPFAILRAVIEYDVLIELANVVLYLYPIYLPVLFALFGIKIFKATDKIFFPILLFDIVLVFVIYFLAKMILYATERNLAGAVIARLLIEPLIYSIPISFIAAAIYKYKNQKSKNTANTTNTN